MDLLDKDCVNALLQAFAFPRTPALSKGGMEKCVNALLQAFAFPLCKDRRDEDCHCVNALLQAFAFPPLWGSIAQPHILC